MLLILQSLEQIFEHSEVGKAMERFRYNDYDRLTLSHLPPAEVSKFYKHHQVHKDYIRIPSADENSLSNPCC